MKAYLFEELSNKKVKCLACSHHCIILNNGKGLCSVRQNREGVLFLDAYGCAASYGVDSVEKKPLYHFLPGSLTFSFGTLGCNFRCGFCQNHDISLPSSFSYKKNLSPEDAVRLALEKGCDSISYTYTEPAVFSEYALDTARLAKKKGLKNVLVSNGFFSLESLEAFCDVVDAVNIDLKSFSDDFYKKNCGARLEPVLRSIKFFLDRGIWVEVTTLVIPGFNDSEDNLRKIARFLVSLSKDIPWHVSRFFPSYKFKDVPPTSLSVLNKAASIGKEEGLSFVYVGNVSGSSDTFCANCGLLLIKRNNFNTSINISNGICVCGTKLRGVF